MSFICILNYGFSLYIIILQKRWHKYILYLSSIDRGSSFFFLFYF